MADVCHGGHLKLCKPSNKEVVLSLRSFLQFYTAQREHSSFQKFACFLNKCKTNPKT